MSSLPLPKGFTNDDVYVSELLKFVSSSKLVNELCGGVHILDFFCQEPNVYESLFPQSWRQWFDDHSLQTVLDLILRGDFSSETKGSAGGEKKPPDDLVQYLEDIRRLSLNRDHTSPTGNLRRKDARPNSLLADVPRHISVGMKHKKLHEVQQISRYVSVLADEVADSTGKKITHFVDFGSGQNYLGRVLASEPYNKHVIGLESKGHNVEAARAMDVLAKLAPKAGVHRNKKEWRAKRALESKLDPPKCLPDTGAKSEDVSGGAATTSSSDLVHQDSPVQAQVGPSETIDGKGSVQYVLHRLQDGDLSAAISQSLSIDTTNSAEHDYQTPSIPASSSKSPELLVISLHSCGNLSHHGLRSLLLNPTVRAVAIVGCCYNMLTERLTAPSYKIPSLRPDHPIASEGDPHGFPMSERLCQFPNADGSRGLRLNITARMMAVQAPQNWSQTDSDGFFTRHFYRALLQRIFVDRGVVEAPQRRSSGADQAANDKGSASQAVIIGSLRKHCYTSFLAYVRGALAKLLPPSADSIDERQPWHPPLELAHRIAERTQDLTDQDIETYEQRFLHRKKHLSIVWSLMAYSAGLIEAVIVVDRWLWLREQMELDIVERCWVESVFDYALSPRNLIVCGVKK